MLRARLSLFALEGRENPSGPALIDPIIGTAPAPVPPPSDPVTVAIINLGAGIAGGAADPTPPAPTTPTSSLGPVDPLFLIPAP